MAFAFVVVAFVTTSSNAAPMFVLAFPAPLESPSALLSSPINEEIKRVHRRDVLAKQEGEEEPEDDLMTAAGTNLMRPLFVYRQQMAYRDRQIKRAAHRRAISVS